MYRFRHSAVYRRNPVVAGGRSCRHHELPARGTPAAIWAEPAQGLGQLVVHDAQVGSPVRLNVASYHARRRATTARGPSPDRQSFYNPFARQQEGTFVFNLPPGASVSRFAMYSRRANWSKASWSSGSGRPASTNRSSTRQRDPAILEQIGDNLFKMRVFPIPPQGTQTHPVGLHHSAGVEPGSAAFACR